MDKASDMFDEVEGRHRFIEKTVVKRVQINHSSVGGLGFN